MSFTTIPTFTYLFRGFRLVIVSSTFDLTAAIAGRSPLVGPNK